MSVTSAGVSAQGLWFRARVIAIVPDGSPLPAGFVAAQLGRRLVTVHHWHRDLHEDDVVALLRCHRNGLVAVHRDV